MATVNPYSILADCYDDVMEHVDYEEWAWYVQEVCDEHDHQPGDVLELGCGTGTFASFFIPLEGVQSFRAVDASPDMIRIAEKKNGAVEAASVGQSSTAPSSVAASSVAHSFAVQSFEALGASSAEHDLYDTVLLLYDGLNYLMKEEEIEDLLERVARVLKPEGLFIFDQSTPANSINNADYFEDSGQSGDVHYLRRSEYDAEAAVHTNSFEMTKDGVTYEEVHRQQCYTGIQIQEVISRSSLKIEAGYSGFSLEAADTESERIHWVLRKS